MPNPHRPKFYTPNEVSVHNSPEDIWVSFLGRVYDLTSLCDRYRGVFWFFLFNK